MSEEAVAARRLAVRTASRQGLARRLVTGRVIQGLCVAAFGLALVPLTVLIVYAAKRGLGVVDADFLFHAPTPEGVPGGGISNALAGTGIILGLGVAMAVPVGLLVALLLAERDNALTSVIRFVADVMSGIPSIAIGIYAYALIVVHTHHYSALAGSFALAVLMLPIVVRSNEEALRAVPVDLAEAGMALGARRSRLVRIVTIPSALPALVTGNLLSVARAVGETAPLLFTAAGSALFTLSPTQPMSTLSLTIFSLSTSPFPEQQQQAWGTVFVLLVIVFVLSLIARAVASFLNRRAQ